jgi:serine/threonine-protein kinase
MGLSSGARLGVYEVTGTLGVGGMGEVYRARDTRLGRQVALKVLPDAVAGDPDRIQRFEREAKVLASLNHPHIAALYGVEQVAPAEGSASPASVLVMELVEGDTLADRLRRGLLAVGEALEIARQIADALDAAHEQGIVHRDLKPANVKVGGSADAPNVKVLDFGLAKPEGPAADAGPTNSPTLSMMATQAGFIMGTAGYMSPEQAKGARVDRRSDVFSFGVVLYEMLTGRPPFGGETAAEVMASVMIRDADFAALPANLTPRLVELLKRCLDKSPKRRWQSMGDLRVEIEAIAAAPYRAAAHTVATTRPPLWRRALPIIAASVATAIVTAIVTTRSSEPPSSPAPLVRFPLVVNNLRQNNRSVAMSPDGTRLAFIGTMDGQGVLLLRDMADLAVRPLVSTGNPNRPVFSPDGQAIAFSTAEEVKRVPVTGGSPTTVAKRRIGGLLDLTWTGDWVVLTQLDGIWRVPASGGEPELLRTPEAGELLAAGELLDDQGSLLFARLRDATDDTWDTADVVLRKPDGTEHVLVEGGNNPRLVRTGHLLFTRSGALMAVAVDLTLGRVSGRAVPMIDGVARSQLPRVSQYSVSDTGTLAYVPAVAIAGRLGTFENGTLQVLPVPPDSYEHPRISPDGRYVAVATDDGKQAAVWIYELGGQGLPRRLTFEGRSLAPVWSPDSRFVTYQSDREGDRGLFRQRADGTGTAERLTRAEPGTEHVPDSWTPDGKVLALRVMRGNASTIWRLRPEVGQSLEQLISSESGSLGAAAFSPDGRWLAYFTEGRPNSGLFVEPFPSTGARFQVISRGYAPVWSRDGSRLYYMDATRVAGVDVRVDGGFSVGQPFYYEMSAALRGTPWLRNYDVMPDGKRFLVVLPPGSGDDTTAAGQTTPPINIVLNWYEELKARAPRQ